MPDSVNATVAEIDFGVAPMAAEVAPVAVLPPPPAPIALDPMTRLIERAACDPNSDIDKLERLIAMKRDADAHRAQVDYDTAMADAQEAMKAIRADAENPQTRSRYATYAALDHAVRPIYSRHGFALSFNTGDAPKADELRVLCTVSHRGGHRQDYKIDMPADGKGARGNDVMTRTHATGAAASYGQRYLLKLIFNLAVGDIDDDGNGAGGDWVDDAERDGLLRNGDRRSTYDATKATAAKNFADEAIEILNLSPNAEAAKEWRRHNLEVPKGKKKSPLQWLKDNSPGQHMRVGTCFENVTGEGL